MFPGDAGHLSAAQPAGTLDLDALRSQTHRALHRLLHGTLVRDALVDLLGDTLGDELCLEFRLVNLLDVQLDLLPSALLQRSLQIVNLRTTLADHDPRLGGEDRHLDLVRRALDLDPRDAGIRQLGGDRLAQLQILMELFDIIAVGEPLRLPVSDIPQAIAYRVNFPTHLNLLAVIDNHGDMRRALANAVGTASGARHKALESRPLVGENRLYDQIVRRHLEIVLGVRGRRLDRTRDLAGGFVR